MPTPPSFSPGVSKIVKSTTTMAIPTQEGPLNTK